MPRPPKAGEPSEGHILNVCPAYLLECSRWDVADGRRPVGGHDYPRTYQDSVWFPMSWRVGSIWLDCAGLTDSPVLAGQRWLLADGRRAVDVRRLWAEDLRHRWHDLPSFNTLVDLVRSDLVRHLAEERGLSPGFAGRPGVRFVRDCMGVVAQARRAWCDRNASCSAACELDQSFLGGRSTASWGATEKARSRSPSSDPRAFGPSAVDLAEVPNGVDQVEFARDVMPRTRSTRWRLGATRSVTGLHRPHRATWTTGGSCRTALSLAAKRWTAHLTTSGNSCPTTSTSSPSGSTGGPPEGGLCSTALTGRDTTHPQRAHRGPATTGTNPQTISLNCTQADMQDVCSIMIWWSGCGRHSGPSGGQRTRPDHR